MSRGEGVQGIQTMHVDISQIGCQVALINKFITSLSLSLSLPKTISVVL